MIINQISLKNFRNYDSLLVKFNKKLNIIIGDNAQGKTNILESIYYLSITKSYRTPDDTNLIKNNKEFFKITAKIKENNIPKKLEAIFNRTNKQLYLNDNLEKKISKFIGILNVVNCCPEDIDIIKGTPSDRRNFLNIELSKLSQFYLNRYNEYNKLLKIRNDYLKMLMVNNISDFRYFDIITDQLIEKAIYIYKERNKFIDQINSYISKIYYDISNINNLIIKYVPNVEINNFNDDDLRKTLKNQYSKSLNREMSLGMTLFGPHRDDIIFTIDNKNIKLFGSQGQQKLSIIALKLSLVNIFNERLESMPILLLDDVFSEIDRKRKNKIMKYIESFGQVIITTNDIRDINKNKIDNYKIFEVKDEKIIEKGDKNGK